MENKKLETEKEITESFKNIFDGILSGVEKETEKNYQKQILALQPMLEDPEDYNLDIMYPMDNILRAAIRVKFPDTQKDDIHKVAFLYQNLTYIKNSLEDIIIKYNKTSACCADQSGFIMHQLWKHYTRGVEFDFSPYIRKEDGKEFSYHIPKFWDKNGGAEWIEFYEALISFNYGHNKKYIEFYAKQIIPLLTTKTDENQGADKTTKEV